MGQFPYECKVCGGGYKRCGNQDKGDRRIEFNMDGPCGAGNESGNESVGDESCTECEGGQFCWEEACVIIYNGNPIYGFYDGYGRVQCETKMTTEDIKKYGIQLINKKKKKYSKKGLKMTASRKNKICSKENIERRFVKLDEKIRYYPIQFEEHFDVWFRDPKSQHVDENEKGVEHKIAGEIYCQSCYIKEEYHNKV